MTLFDARTLSVRIANAKCCGGALVASASLAVAFGVLIDRKSVVRLRAAYCESYRSGQRCLTDAVASIRDGYFATVGSSMILTFSPISKAIRSFPTVIGPA